MNNFVGKYITIVNRGLAGPRARTFHFDVLTRGGDFLGHIAWFRNWRRYAFYPNTDTVFEETCLREIASYCEGVTATQRTMAGKAIER